MSPTRGWRCSRKGCAARAGFFPQLYLWAQGWPGRDKRNALNTVFTLPLCGPCSSMLSPEDLWTDESFARIRDAVASRGGAPPDRASALLAVRRLEDFRHWAPVASGLKLPPENFEVEEGSP